MRFKVGGKLGYLNTRTGRYSWAEIVEVRENELLMKKRVRFGKDHTEVEHYVEIISTVKRCLATECEFMPYLRYLMKYKGK